MQCPECSYISFKIEKACRACGFKFKNEKKNPFLLGKESFSIFAPLPVEDEQKIEEEKENIIKSIGVLEASEAGPFMDSETGDFKLDLSNIEDNEIKEAKESSVSDKETSEYELLDFDTNTDINLGKIETGGLGTGEEEIGETQSAKIESTGIKEAKTSDENPSLETALEITESEEVPAISEKPFLEFPELVEEPDLSTEPVLELPETEEESIAPELDLGDNEVKLDLSYELPPLNTSIPVADVQDLNLKIDDSEGPWITENSEVSEIKDLGLELEPLDESEKDKN